ncbi:unnamed protein product [Rhizophagus irregularis]|uniref:Uncharacterized protein n=1 Tax=Rhizophagus irregularis TaxID=588596 RepID=A0A915ZM43_9GLOM|nr:unnamed protein product [Rhizophagus irregularis]CAB5380397.1 unnamed protein product [Rhizophagus irregularis]
MRFYFSLRFCKSYQKHSNVDSCTLILSQRISPNYGNNNSTIIFISNCRAIPSNSVKRFTSTDLTEIDYNTDFDPNVKKGTYRTENFY